MRELLQLIPSGHLLYVFDAAARRESFSRAAEELNVTPAAVSHAIRQLETSLGVSLFERGHRQLRVSGAGAKLFQSVSTGLDRIENTACEIQTAQSPNIIKLYASITIATYWLLPRLAALRHHEPNMELRLYNSDRSLELPADGTSLAITGGRRDWVGYETSLFAKELIFPVCSPAYKAKHEPFGDLGSLGSHTLLHLDEAYHDGVTWMDFLDRFGIEHPKAPGRLIYNNYILVLHAAIAGEGIALGWQHAVGELVEKGELVRPFDVEFISDSDFYVVSRKGRNLDEKAQALQEWLVKESVGSHSASDVYHGG